MPKLSLQFFIHYFLHFGAPFIIALVWFRDDWLKITLILLATMLVDLDHVFATPFFQDDRCSIGLHPLHTYWAMAVYVALLFLRKPWNIIGIGLLLHMLADSIDCGFMAG